LEVITIPADNLHHESAAGDTSCGIVPLFPAVGIPDLRQLLRRDDVSASHYVAYRDRPAYKGEPGLVVARMSKFGFEKIISDYFPPTEEGWSNAWKILAATDSEDFERFREIIKRDEKKYQERAEQYKLRQELDQNTRTLLGDSIFLGGHLPSRSLIIQSAYDVRFMDDSLQVLNVGTLQTLMSLSYDRLTGIQIAGPGSTESTSPFVDSAGRIVGSALRATQSGVNENILNATENLISMALRKAAARRSIKTVLVVKTTDSELFFLDSKTEPFQLRIDLSPAYGRIEKVDNSTSVDRHDDRSRSSDSLTSQLGKAEDLLNRGVITQI
jgi:hypothetical protein